MTTTEPIRTHAPRDVDATLRYLPAISDAIDQLTRPRLIHTEIRDNGHGGITSIHTEQHPPLIDLLEHGTGSTNRGRSSGIRIPIDAEAHELLKEIRHQVTQWRRNYRLHPTERPQSRPPPLAHPPRSRRPPRRHRRSRDPRHPPQTRPMGRPHRREIRPSREARVHRPLPCNRPQRGR
jgi:hypothetical protein